MNGEHISDPYVFWKIQIGIIASLIVIPYVWARWKQRGELVFSVNWRSQLPARDSWEFKPISDCNSGVMIVTYGCQENLISGKARLYFEEKMILEVEWPKQVVRRITSKPQRTVKVYSWVHELKSGEPCRLRIDAESNLAQDGIVLGECRPISMQIEVRKRS